MVCDRVGFADAKVKQCHPLRRNGKMDRRRCSSTAYGTVGLPPQETGAHALRVNRLKDASKTVTKDRRKAKIPIEGHRRSSMDMDVRDLVGLMLADGNYFWTIDGFE